MLSNKEDIKKESTAEFDRVIKESPERLTQDKPKFFVIKDGKEENIFLEKNIFLWEIEKALNEGKLVKVVKDMFGNLYLEIENGHTADVNKKKEQTTNEEVKFSRFDY